ncbi:P-loop containing nucleoside triphosphate hydrolase protein [Gymnopus androsaceus JB14]|uniref:P-loop containing nucleoside triphosphate hydrolase protein n=1 Tax=Gymnopus androsaceus JB14 TaxID=1447944 RepID=A0A6A4HQH0_9AGAR|nr:P-loop containing nucleoside triphosphate hydrolase protein [Gymnopus androsaceus JB14]
MIMVSLCSDDDHFGPQVQCRAFDFTVVFENAILSLLPSLLFSIYALYTILRLGHIKAKFTHSLDHVLKIATIISNILFNFLALVSWALLSDKLHVDLAYRMVAAATAVNLVASVLALVLVNRFPNDTPILSTHSLFLLVMVILSTSQVRTFVIIRSQLSVFFLGAFLGGYATRLFSRFLIIWALPMIWKGRRGNFQINDLEELHDSLESSAIFETFERAWKHPKQLVDGKPSLKKALLRSFLLALLSPVLPGLVHAFMQGFQPLLVLAALKFIQSYSDTSPETIPQPAEYGYALAGAFALVYFGLAASTGLYYTAIYRTASQLRAALAQAIYRKTVRLSAASSASGQVNPVNLISSDVRRLTSHIDPLHQLWMSGVVLIIGLIILHGQIGVSFIASIVTIIIVLVLLPWLSASISARSAVGSIKADYRIRLISGIINQIRGIKLSGYESELLEKVADAREKETIARKHMWIQFSKVVALTSVTSNFLSLATLATYSIVSVFGTGFDSLGTSRLFTVYAVMSVVAAPLMQAGQYWPGVVKSYQSIERIETFLNYPESEDVSSPTYRSESEPYEKGLRDISLQSLNSLGSEVIFDNATIGWEDKTVLKNVNLQLPLNKCTMIVGRVASGKSTLLATMLQETTVLSGKIRYPWTRGSIAYCSQKPWIQSSRTLAENILFVSSMDPHWYRTVVKAPSADKLSGGQQARIALARALYTRKEIFVFDDPLSALDSTTSDTYLQGSFRTTRLATWKDRDDTSHLQAADTIIDLNDTGIMLSYNSSSEEMISMSSSSLHVKEKKGVDVVIEINEADVPVSILDEDVLEDNTHNEKQHNDTESPNTHDIETVNSGAIGFQPISGVRTTTLISQMGIVVLQRVMLGKYLGGYAAFELLFSISISALFFYALPILANFASINLHASAMSAVLASPLHFFSSTTAGQIISRFSQDMTLIDTDFPIAMYDLTYQGLGIIGSIIILIVTVPYLTIVVVVVALLCYLVQKFYIATSRQLRRLDLASNSPVYTLTSETLEVNGLFTIRAAGAEDALIDRNTSLLSPSQRTYHYSNVTRIWLNTTVAYLTAIINTFVMLIAVLGRHSTNVSLLGVAMSQAVSLQEAVSLLLVSLATAEVAAVAVERNLEYSELTPEEPKDTKDSIQNWSLTGMITFDNVIARYDGQDEPVLKGISFHIPAGSRTALCGRTGSGKSTAFLALLRAVSFEGRIMIDGLSTKDLSLKTLRKNIAIVTQDPFVLEGTLRENLDVSGKLPDEEIWLALEAVQLKSTALEFPNKLDQELTSSGNDFSQGQMQLLALGRALLRKSKIVILDEATANLDMETDRSIQEIIRSALKGVTVITIAHRIHTITDYDQIVVLEQGQIAEVGVPADLLKNDDGPLAQLLKDDTSSESRPREESQ